MGNTAIQGVMEDVSTSVAAGLIETTTAMMPSVKLSDVEDAANVTYME